MTGHDARAGWERDLELLRDWWQAVSASHPASPDTCGGAVPPGGVDGLWFGLAELLTLDGLGRHLYVAGCPTFDADDLDAEWATEHVWGPSEPVLVPGIATFVDEDHTLALAHAAELVRTLDPWPTRSEVGIAVGFDDGDFVVVRPSRH